MKRFVTLLTVLLALTLVLSAGNISRAQDEIVIYMQMGGTQGDPTTLARTNGAKAAAEALGIELHEQYSSWDQQAMLNQFSEFHQTVLDNL